MKKEVKIYPNAKVTKIVTSKEDGFVEDYSHMDNQYRLFKGKSINYHIEISDPKIVRIAAVISAILILIPAIILFIYKIRIAAIFLLAVDIILVVDTFQKTSKKNNNNTLKK